MFYQAVFSSVLLLISAPFFYGLMQYIYRHQTDETLTHRSQYFVSNTLPHLQSSNIAEWNRTNSDQRISLPERPFYRPFFCDTFMIDSAEMETEPYRILYTPIRIDGEQYVLRQRLSLLEREDAIRGIVGIYMGLLVCLLAGLYLINRRISKILWKPFYDTLAYIGHFDIEQPDLHKLPDLPIIEFNQLNQAINSLIAKNSRSYFNEKEFVENAAHELQTPIAVFQSRLDVLLQKPPFTNEQAATIQSLYVAAARLSRLNKNLLTLAKIDATNYHDIQQLNLNECLQSTWSNFSDQAENERIKVAFFLADDTMISANPDIFELLLNNLFSNAIRHNYSNGSIEITLKGKVLEVSNTAIAPELPAEGLFHRFTTFNTQTKGNGLGLAIVAAICKKCRWGIRYSYRNFRHSFIVSFAETDL